MKKTILAATILAMASATAFAEDGGDNFTVDAGNKGAGEVIFKGEVKAASCDITVAGQANNAVVKLPIINTAEFVKADTKYKPTQFDIVLSNCNLGEDQSTVSVSWTEGTLDDVQKGYLTNRLSGADAATGVSLVISDKTGKTMIPGTHAGTTPVYNDSNSTASADYDKTNKTATIPFTVAYVQTGAAAPTAGKVESAAVYSVFYN